MAQKITGYVKLQIPAGKATPAPPVGPALGQHGVNIAAFTKEFNERTKNCLLYTSSPLVLGQGKSYVCIMSPKSSTLTIA